jgi:hypothetical protein
MGYVEQAALSRDSAFLDQVRIAMAVAGTQIAGESNAGKTTTQYQKRQQLAYAVLNSPDGYLSRFALAVAQNAAVVRGNPVSISSSTNANPIVVTTASAHGLSTGAVVEIAGHLVNTAANGSWTATSITSTTFSVPVAGNGVGTASGTVVKMPIDSDVQFTVNSVWDDVAGITVTD